MTADVNADCWAAKGSPSAFHSPDDHEATQGHKNDSGAIYEATTGDQL